MNPELAARAVIETDVVAVQEDDEGTPSRVNDYAVLNMLGEGSFSKVYHCKNGRGEECAIKILKKSFLKRKREYKKVEGKMVFCNALQKVQREAAIMKKLSHTNLVKLYGIIDSPADDKMSLVLELVQGGQVMNWDDKAFRYRAPDTPSGVLQKEDARNCMRDVVMALSYLHANHICHRDPPSPTATAMTQEQQQQQQNWEGPSFGNLEQEVSVESPDSLGKPRRSMFTRVSSKRKSLLEVQDSLQMLLRRKSSAKLTINDSRGSEAYESKIYDTTANTVANVAANANHHHKHRLPAVRSGHAMAVGSDPTATALVRSSSQTGQEALQPVSALCKQTTVVCSIM